MTKYDRQIQRVRHMPQLTEQDKRYIIFLIKELRELFMEGRFSVFPTYDYSKLALRWDKVTNIENKPGGSANNFMELIVDPKQGNIVDFHFSLVEPYKTTPP